MNTWGAKLKRTLTSPLPISKDRKGSCRQCGACCMLPNRCPFLGEGKEGFYCKVYRIRPLVCRKYPRVESEHVTKDICGYWWKELKTESSE